MKALIYKGIVCLGITLSITFSARAQSSSVTIGPGALKSNAVLWLVPTGGQGLILPSVTTGTRTGMSLNNSDDKGMLVFDNQLNKVFFWSGTGWVDCGPGSGGSTPTLGSGQVLVGNGTTNSAATVIGDLTMNNGNFQIAAGTITAADMAASSVSGGAAGTITDGTIVNADLSTTAAVAVTKLAAGSNGQILTTVAGVPTWAAGGGTTPTLGSGQVLVGNGTTNSAAAVGGDLTMNNGNFQIAAGTIAAADMAASSVSGGAAGTIQDATITNADIATAAAIDVSKLNSGGAGNNGLVLKVVAGALTFANDDVGGGATPTLTTGQVLVGNGTTNSGVTVTGDLTMNNGNFQIAAGTIAAADMAASSVSGGAGGTIADGTIIAADLAAGSVSGGAAGTITDGTIVNADLSATAAVAVTKLAAGSNGQVLTTVAGIPTWAAAGSATPTLGSGQVLVGNGTTNTAAAVGGDLTMNNGNFQIAAGVIAAADMAASSVSGGAAGTITDGSIIAADLAAGSVSGGAAGTITDGTIINADISGAAAIDISKLNSGGAGNNGLVLKVVAGALTFANDDVGGGATPTLTTGQVLVGNGTTNSGVTVTGDLTMNNGNFQIAAGTIAAADMAASSVSGGAGGTIADGTIIAADLAAGSVSGGAAGTITDGTIVNADLSATAAVAVTKLAAGSNGQVLTTVAGIPTWAAAGSATPTLGSGQVLVGNGTTNTAAAVGGDLTMNNGNFQIAAGVIAAADMAASSVSGGAGGTIADGTIIAADLAAGSVSGGAAGTIADGTIIAADLAAGSVSGGAAGTITDGTIINADISGAAAIDISKLNSGGAGNNGLVLKVVAGALTFANDDVGGGATPTLTTGQVLVGNGTTNSGVTVTGDLTMNNGNFQIAAGTIAATDMAASSVSGGAAGTITDGTIINADISGAAAIAVTKLAAGTNTQVLTTVAGVPTWAAVGGATPTLGSGQVLVGDGTTNTAVAVSGDLTMNNGNFQIAAGTIAATDMAASSVSGGAAGTIADGSIIAADLAAGSVSGGAAGTITDGTIINADISGAAAIAVTKLAAGTNTQVLTTVAGVPTWAAAGAATPTLGTGQVLVGNGTTNSAVAVGGDLTMNNGNFQIAAGTIAAADMAASSVSGGAGGTITDGTIIAADLAAGSVSGGAAGTITDATITNADIAAAAAIAVTKLAAGTNTQVLTTVAGVPTWAAPPASTDAQQLTLTGTTLDLTNDGTPVVLGGLSILDQVTLNSGQVTGILPVANGGTGRATWDGLLFGDATGISDIGGGTNGQILRMGGATPGWTNFAVTSADITDGTITGADLATNINITTTGNITTNAPGNLSIAGTSTLTGAATLSNLSGAGTRMVVASPTGLLSTQALPVAGWSLLGNAGTNPATNFIGTTDAIDFSIRVNNVERLHFNSTKVSTGSTIIGGSSFDGHNLATTGFSHGIYGESDSPAGGGVLGNSFVGGNGVHGYSNSGNGVAGFSDTGVGVYGQSGGSASGVSGFNTATGPGVTGSASGANQAGVVGINDVATGRGVYGTSINGIAVYSNGRTVLNGPLGLGGTPNYGTAGQVLSSNGNAAAPGWITVSGTALSTNGVIPKGNGVTQVASSMSEAGTITTTTNDFNIASGRAYMINNVDVLRVSGGVNGGLYVGDNAGPATAGIHNTLIGVEAGNSTTTGNENTFIGRRAGYLNVAEGYNVFVGKNAGYNNVANGLNTYVGWSAGYRANATQGGNTYIGAEAGNGPASGPFNTASYNTFVGEQSGLINTTGEQNTYVGRLSGSINETGSRLTLIGHQADILTAGSNLSNSTAIGYLAKVSANNSFILGATGANAVNVGIGITAPETALHVVEETSGGYAVTITKGGTGNQGLIAFEAADGTFQGGISLNGGTVTYAAFTGSHYGILRDNVVPDLGRLVSLTGVIKRADQSTSEPKYEVIESTTPNDPKVMGAYLGDEPGTEGLHLIMAVGNGEMWVVDNGENLSQGDYLISSAVAGHAMKDNGEFEVSYVVARVAEPIDWTEVTAVIDGKKHKRISVFFESFTRNHKAEKIEKDLNKLQADVRSSSEQAEQRIKNLENEIELLKKLMGVSAKN